MLPKHSPEEEEEKKAQKAQKPPKPSENKETFKEEEEKGKPKEEEKAKIEEEEEKSKAEEKSTECLSILETSLKIINKLVTSNEDTSVLKSTLNLLLTLLKKPLSFTPSTLSTLLSILHTAMQINTLDLHLDTLDPKILKAQIDKELIQIKFIAIYALQILINQIQIFVKEKVGEFGSLLGNVLRNLVFAMVSEDFELKLKGFAVFNGFLSALGGEDMEGLGFGEGGKEMTQVFGIAVEELWCINDDVKILAARSFAIFVDLLPKLEQSAQEIILQ
jgi:hypothetical protein